MNESYVSQNGLENQLKYSLMDCASYENRSTRHIKHLFSKARRYLRETYCHCAKHGVSTETEQWVYDNYYIIEQLYQGLLGGIKSSVLPHSKELPDVYRMMEFFLKNRYEWSTKSMMDAIDLFEGIRFLTNYEFDHLKSALQVMAIIKIEEIVKNDDSDDFMKYCFDVLFQIDQIDFEAVIRTKNHLEHIYQQDPSKDYNRMDIATKRIYRDKTSKTAILQGIDEIELAKSYIKQANEAAEPELRHVGSYIYGIYQETHGNLAQQAYLPCQVFLPLIAAIILAFWSKSWWIILPIYFLFWEIFKPIIIAIFLRLGHTEYTPRMRITKENLEKGNTLVTISVMLDSISDAQQLTSRLKKLYYGNHAENIRFCILADLKPGEYPQNDQDHAIALAAGQVIRKLNRDIEDCFSIVIRKRVYSTTQNCYSGWERKRGAITELIRFIKTGEHSFQLLEGNTEQIRTCKYLLALDSDTVLLPESVNDLVSAALHPLNQPIIDPKRNIVTKGYGIFAPRISTDLRSSVQTPFAKIYSGIGGINTYDPLATDIYQDLYEEGIFSGKGLINIEIFYQLLDQYFLEESILSHDILESGFLRTRFVSDVETVDSFPSNAISYFKRQHRWVRGDLQNISFFMPSIPTAKGKQKNPLKMIHRFQLFDNIRRAFQPVFCLFGIFLAAFTPNVEARVVLTITVFFSAIASELFSLFYSIATDGIWALSKQYYSRIFPQCIQSILKAFYNLVLLAQEAYCNLDAIIRALYRKYVSHKNLLEWTTAAQGENNSTSMLGTLKFCWFSELTGILLLLSSHSSIRIFGLFFILAWLLIFVSSVKYKIQKQQISEEKKSDLISQAAMMLRYYTDYCTASEHYLPPDNVQQAPVYRVAHRTSPTNIGMYLLSILSARDFQLIDSNKMSVLLNQTLTTLEKMQKWHGNLYNWYDTRTLSILQPAYVSAVDSGNLCCCLVALKEGILEYSHEEPQLNEIAHRFEILLSQTDLTPFYDKNKKLFFIGYDETNEQMSGSHYDMLMSEARMTSYLAVASRQVPRNHWGALSRTLVNLHSYSGPVSWTGTTFEYFMPELLLSCPEGSLGYEGLRFCLYAQKQHAKRLKLPYGISESAFFAFDSSLNYQYKAHGVQKLALKQGMNDETVISPYSTYLTLPYDFDSGYRNLKRLFRMGMRGKYGLYESVDFTQKRIGNSPFEIIKSHMAHHIGMSIVAINNTLNHHIMQKRFFNDSKMNCATELLQERILSGSMIFHSVSKSVSAKSPKNAATEIMAYSQMYPQRPRLKLLSNKELTAVYTDTGINHILYQGKDIFKKTQDFIRNPAGFFGAVWIDNKIISFTQAPNYDSKNDYHRETVFYSDAVGYHTETEKLNLQMKSMIHASVSAEIKQISLKNNVSEDLNPELLFYFEPVLAKTQDDNAHPTFSKMFVSVEYDPIIKAICAKRKSRGNQREAYLAIAFRENIDFTLETRRQELMNSPEGIHSIFSGMHHHDFHSTDGTPDACIAIKCNQTLRPKETSCFHLIISAGNSQKEVMDHIVELRRMEKKEFYNTSKEPFVPQSIESRIADLILPQLVFKKRYGNKIFQAIKENRKNKKDLWKFGVSGDLPIVLIEAKSVKDREQIRNYFMVQNCLRVVGIHFDLVVIYREGAEYLRPIASMVEEIVSEYGDRNLLNAAGGVYSIDLFTEPETTELLFRAAASHIASQSMAKLNLPQPEYQPIEVLPSEESEVELKDGLKCYGGVFSDQSFYCDSKTKLPWCHVLSNPSFGTLVSNKSLGFTWAVNSRENKLTPWSNDVMTDQQGEYLIAQIGDRYYNLVLGSRVEFHPDYAKYYAKVENFEIITTVSVPSLGMKKKLDLEIQYHGNEEQQISIAYYVEPVLGVNRETSEHLVAFEERKGVITLINPFQQAVRSVMAVASNALEPHYCYDRVAFFSGRWKETSSLPNNEPCVAHISELSFHPAEKQKLTYQLTFQCYLSGIQQLEMENKKESFKNRFEISTPDQALNYLFNTWLMHQVDQGRIKARTGFYQCGGAWGFRDQLQDSCAVLYRDPNITKRQILRCCASQFEEGDVLHWWHQLPAFGGGKKGVRTRYSDDLLWLPYTVCEYLDKTEDDELLSIPVAYCCAPLLEPEEAERYVEVTASKNRDTVYIHCIRAIDYAFSRLGEHGIPLIGGGDWNDGLNLVGIKGKGESVWLAQFLSLVMKRFSQVCEKQGEQKRAEEYRSGALMLLKQVDLYCWDGNWYLRAFTDSGEALGSSNSMEGKIDSLPQSFSVLSEMENSERVHSAINSAYQYLVDHKKHLIMLFTPAYDKTPLDLGYIKAYPTGIRENGGQYTHAAIWLAIAMLKAGEDEKGYELVKMLNPIYHSMSKEQQNTYLLEPYYIAADIYTNQNNYGRGGWSIYTGAAAWYYRCILEYLLGIQIKNGKLYVDPHLPKEWPEYTAKFHYQNTDIDLTVKRSGKSQIFVNGEPRDTILLDGNKKVVEVLIL